MHPVLFKTDFFGVLSEPLSLHTYGLMIALGFLAAMHLTRREAEREGEDGELIVDLSFYVLLFGLLGGRLLFIITKAGYYAQQPLEIFKIWRGGLVWYGGFIVAVAFLVWFCRKHQLSLFKICDIIIPNMAFAHAVGRLGCLAAGCCFGSPTDHAWGIVFPVDSMVHQAQVADGLIGYGDPSLPVHATQLYEALAEFVLFAGLVMYRRHKRFHGHLFLLWIAVYPVMRGIIEVFRGDKERGVYILSTSQYISIVIAAAAIALYFYFKKRTVALQAR